MRRYICREMTSTFLYETLFGVKKISYIDNLVTFAIYYNIKIKFADAVQEKSLRIVEL